jgi:hypothetical protein
MHGLRLVAIALAFSAVAAIQLAGLDDQHVGARTSSAAAAAVPPADSAWGGGYIPAKPDAVSLVQ